MSMESDLMRRGAELPESCRLQYVSEPGHGEQSRWIFAGATEVKLGAREAELFIIEQEAKHR